MAFSVSGVELSEDQGVVQSPHPAQEGAAAIEQDPTRSRRRIVCIGGATIDVKYRCRQALRPGTSNPAIRRRSFGGVARNVAETLARLGTACSLVSAVGDDENGRSLLRHLEASFIDTAHVAIIAGRPTAEYVAVSGPDNDLAFGIADMDILDAITIAQLESAAAPLDPTGWVFADCNLPQPVLARAMAHGRDGQFRVAVDAVSSPKVMRLGRDLHGIDLLFMNVAEAAALLEQPAATDPRAMAETLLQRGAGSVILTCGEAGLLVADAADILPLRTVTTTVLDVTGAGDALIAGTLSRLQAGEGLVESCRIGMLAALLTIESEDSVNPAMSPALIERHLHRLPAHDRRTVS